MSLQAFLYNAERDHWWYQARRNITTYLFWNTLSGKEKVLSVGCGTGQELLHISKYATVTGLDIDPNVANFCQRHNIDVVIEDISKTSFANNTFDVIVAMDIIEHIKDDKKAINEIHRILKPGGKLLVTVPACPFLWSEYDEMGEYPHYRRYTSVSLRNLLSSHFSFQIFSYYNFFLFPLILIIRKLNFNFHTQLQQPSRIINFLFRSIFSLERFILRFVAFPIGVSLIAICKNNKIG